MQSEKSERLKQLDSTKLMDVVKNYRQYGYDEQLRAQAIAILEERGFSQEHLKLTGNFENHDYAKAEQLLKSFASNSKRALYFYLLSLMAILLLLGRLDVPFFFEVVEIIYWGAVLSYFYFLFKSFQNQHDFSEIAGGSPGGGMAFSYILLGMPFYIFMYFYFKGQMREKMQLIR